VELEGGKREKGLELQTPNSSRQRPNRKKKEYWSCPSEECFEIQEISFERRLEGREVIS